MAFLFYWKLKFQIKSHRSFVAFFEFQTVISNCTTILMDAILWQNTQEVVLIFLCLQIVNEELWARSSEKVLTTNKLTTPLMKSLNKKKYNFDASNRVLAAINGGKPVAKEQVDRPEYYKDRLSGIVILCKINNCIIMAPCQANCICR